MRLGRVRGRGKYAPFAAAVALTLALGGCTVGAEQPAPDSSAQAGLPEGVTAEILQLRSDVAARQASVRVRNGGAEPLTIGALRVDDARFDGPAVRVSERESIVAPGGSADIRIQLPPAACPGTDEGESRLTATLVHGDATAEATAPLPEAIPFLAALHDRECRSAAVADAAELSFASFAPSDAGAPADLVLAVRPTGAADARILGIRTTNLLTFGQSAGDTADTYPIGIVVAADDPSTGSGTAAIDVHLPLVPLRCDAHAVQEDKRGTVFTLEVDVAGETGDIELAASPAMRGAILDWVGRWCGFGAGGP